MRKAGSSNSKSKTPKSSKRKPRPRPERELSDGANTGELAEALSVGHVPLGLVKPEDERLFRAFQSNLLSLISHELRTPLMGILNSVSLLEPSGAAGETTVLSQSELVEMAKRNAQRLQRSLASLLDLAALESQTFHVRLKEISLFRLVRLRAEQHRKGAQERGIAIHLHDENPEGVEVPALADPQKLGRALDLCFEALIPRVKAESALKLRISSKRVSFSFKLDAEFQAPWDEKWTEAIVGRESGAGSPVSAFAGVMVSEQDFLTRTEEGLGSEFLLIHEMMRLHEGKFTSESHGDEISIALELPELSPDATLKSVLASRAYEASTELNSVGLAIISVPSEMKSEAMRTRLKKSLFRSSDAVYALPDRDEVALVMDDCKPEDLPRVIARLETEAGLKLIAGLASCPEDGSDPERLLEAARARLEVVASRAGVKRGAGRPSRK